jgi:hypothetical protein
LIRAEQFLVNENKIFDWVHQGDTIHEITQKGGYF